MNIYTDINEPTLDLEPFRAEDDEPTLDVHLTRSDAIYEAHECMRSGENEAAGVWFLVAEGIDGR